MMFAPAAVASVKAFSASMPHPPQTKFDRKIKIGIIGLGHRGMLIGNQCLAHGGFEILAVADYFEEVLSKQGKSLGVPENHMFAGLSGYKRVLDARVTLARSMSKWNHIMAGQ